MKYELYIDTFVMTNFWMDFVALFITKEITRKKVGAVRLLVGAFVSSLVSAVLFLVLNDYVFYAILIHFVVNPCMLYFVFREKEKKLFLGEWAITYLAILFLGGIMQWLYVVLAKYHHFALCFMIATMLGVVVLCFLEKKRTIGENVYQVKIKNKERELNLTAYYDSGNLLMDPFFHEPVSIIDEESICQVTEEHMPVRLIPFCSLGEENGIIKVLTLEEMRIYRKQGELVIKPVILGIGKKELFQGAGYNLLLNEKMMRR